MTQLNLDTRDEFEAFVVAGNLHNQGYRRTSNKYKIVSRIDRDDWLDVLAKSMNCTRADFYKLDGSGVADNWKDHYIRCYSKDKLTVSELVYRQMQGY